ncbi:MAG: AMP-binding protein [Actinomycetota bacterium]|jgi:malonyl-CoA/methylmalonyl-CoA synthetase|nr:AMP-binding protein [Actinomycetota bacterium]
MTQRSVAVATEYTDNLLVATLLGAGRRTPHKVAVRHVGGDMTYAHLDELSARMAHALVDVHSVTRGDRVVVQSRKVPEVLALNVACARVGAIFTPLNVAYTEREVSDLLDDASPTLLVRDQAMHHATARVSLDELVRESSHFTSRFDDVASDASTPAALLFTSGTTGRPKGAILSQGNLVFGCTTLNQVWEMSSEDVLVHVLPLFHVHGLFVAAYCVLSSGASMRLLEGFDVGEVLGILPESTIMMGVPTHYTRLLDDERLSATTTTSMRLFISGSAPMLRTTHEDFYSRTGHRLLERYGMTETGMITSNPLRGERRIGTVGPALPGVEVRVSGGSPGVVEVRGPNVFAEYWRRPELRQSEFTPDGFFITGDLGILDDDGYLEIVGRTKDLIITGGLNVYPKELELILDTFPGVLESAVVGAPDADFGEAVSAFVVARPGERVEVEDLRLRARAEMASFKVPKHFLVVPSLPRNAMGKVQKTELRRALVERLTRSSP